MANTLSEILEIIASEPEELNSLIAPCAFAYEYDREEGMLSGNIGKLYMESGAVYEVVIGQDYHGDEGSWVESHTLICQPWVQAV